MPKRLRILAGPNGSGKTSVYRDLRDKFFWGIFLNADEIERTLHDDGYIDLCDFGIECDASEIEVEYRKRTAAFPSICTLDDIEIEGSRLSIVSKDKIDSYFSAFIVSYIRDRLIEKGVSFSLETVMSHNSKIAFMKEAREKGYRIYLYFVSTQSPEINVGRVRTRVQEGGHDVPEDKIRSRYSRSNQNLYDAIKESDRAYVFDNSEQNYRLLAEYDATEKRLTVSSITPWFEEAVLSKL